MMIRVMEYLPGNLVKFYMATRSKGVGVSVGGWRWDLYYGTIVHVRSTNVDVKFGEGKYESVRKISKERISEMYR